MAQVTSRTIIAEDVQEKPAVRATSKLDSGSVPDYKAQVNSRTITAEDVRETPAAAAAPAVRATSESVSGSGAGPDCYNTEVFSVAGTSADQEQKEEDSEAQTPVENEQQVSNELFPRRIGGGGSKGRRVLSSSGSTEHRQPGAFQESPSWTRPARVSQPQPPAPVTDTGRFMPVEAAYLVVDEPDDEILSLGEPGVEIPPDSRSIWNANRKSNITGLVILVIIVLVGAVVGGVCGTGFCANSGTERSTTENPNSSSSAPGPTPAPSVVDSSIFLNTDSLYETLRLVISANNNDSLAIKQYGQIEDWQVQRVTDFTRLFDPSRLSGVETFSRDLSRWNVSSATTMDRMFFNAPLFQSDISGWDVSNVLDMTSLFEGAVMFNQNLCVWGNRVPATVIVGDMFVGSGCPNTTSPDPSSFATGPWCQPCVE